MSFFPVAKPIPPPSPPSGATRWLAVGIVALFACQARHAPTPPAPREATPLQVQTTHEIHRDARAEIHASYEVDEGWSVTAWLGRDGCFRQLESLGTPSGDDEQTVCTGCIGQPEDLWKALDGAAPQLAPLASAYPQSIVAERGVGGHIGRYAVILHAGSTKTAPVDKATATALVPALRQTLEAVETTIDNDGRSQCAAARACSPELCQSEGSCYSLANGWSWNGTRCEPTRIDCRLVPGSCTFYPTLQPCIQAHQGCLP